MNPLVIQALTLDIARRRLDAELSQVSGRMGKRGRLRLRLLMQELGEQYGRLLLTAAGMQARAGDLADPIETWVTVTAVIIQTGVASRQDLVEAFNDLNAVPEVRA